MNPLMFARSAGFSTDDIMSFFAKHIPGFEGKMSEAMAAGYTADQVLGFLQKQFQGATVDKRTARYLDPIMQDEAGLGRRGKMPARTQMSDGIGSLAAGAVGAAVGGAMGGPAGAIQGAVAGASSVGDLMKAYDRHVAEGGRLGLSDFMKAAAKGVGSAALAKQAMNLVGQLEVGEGADKEAVQPDVPGVETIDVRAEEVQTAPTEPQFSSDEAKSILSKAGVFNQLETLSKNNPTDILAGAARSILGQRRSGDLEKRVGMQIEDIVSAAFPGEGIEVSEVAETATQPKTQEQKPQVRAPKTPLVYDPTTKTDDITIEAVGRTLGQAVPQKPVGKPKRFDPIRALPSSNIRDVFYDPSQNYMQALFSSGALYEYFNVPREDVQAVLDGEGVAKTIGQSPFRVYHPEKDDGSIGAAFNELIKGKQYDYNKIDDDRIRDKATRAIKKADRIIRATDTLDGFANIMEKAKAKQEMNAPHVQQALQDAALDLDDQQLEDIIHDIRMEMRKYARYTRKNPEKVSKPYTGWTPARMKKALKGELGESKRKTGNPKEVAKV